MSTNEVDDTGATGAHTDKDHCCDSGPPPAQAQTAAVGKGTAFRIDTMDCAAEESEIRRALAPVAGVRGLSFQLGARIVTIDAPEALIPEALLAIRKAGFDPQPVANDGPAPGAIAPVSRGLWRLGFGLALAIAAELLAFFAPETLAFKVLGMALAAAAIGLAGLSTYKKGLAALRRGQFNINALMAVAVTGAFLIGQWPEAAMVMALYAIAELIEGRALDRARNAIKSLLDLAPDTAEVREAGGDWKEIAATEVALETIVRVKPGARVPLDGVITAGNTAINQAPVTGESIPVDKAPGDPVFAGTINDTGMIEMRVQGLPSAVQKALKEATSSTKPKRAPKRSQRSA